MKVFIGWSGEASQALAEALREWIPLVLHYVEPWMSKVDIAAGARWGQEIAEQLEDCDFGVMCLTPENVETQWIGFEAGALSKSMEEGRVVPLLLNLEPNDIIIGPLAQFQAKKVDESGIGDVIKSINEAGGKKVPEATAETLFDELWHLLKDKLPAIRGKVPTPKEKGEQDVLEDLVTGVRLIMGRLGEVERALASDSTGSFRPSRRSKIDAIMLPEVLRTICASEEDPVALLVGASIFRERLPWLYELGLEAYRAARAGAGEDARKARDRFARGLKLGMDGRLPVEQLGLHQGEFVMLAGAIYQFLAPKAKEEKKTKPKRRAKKKSKGN